MSSEGLQGYLDRMHEAASDVSKFIEGMEKDAFLKDVIMQRAIGMSLLMVGEVATRIIEVYPEFVEEHSELQWRQIRGMRNRIAHGYFDIDLGLVWDTAKKAIPDLLDKLYLIRHWQAEGE
ncbi:DUF86 domain-containing protein [Rhizobium tubonense]|uniref:DUF86 domain-containing protein n=1 Tax=Rhizobium tubonense TaxID=484088 RepID=A0A2W4ESE8_9HYPH|nr:HepT-like ribonuclease domain-containing protein [Rhizobium tubonense]PZM13893.1 hypothetical protein CPY51_13620 [Rhizobium tubonense]